MNTNNKSYSRNKANPKSRKATNNVRNDRITRARNNQKQKTIVYETKDFLYNVLCYFKIKPSSASGRLRYEKYQKFQQEVEESNI